MAQTTPISFAVGPDGSDLFAPAGTEKIRIMGCNPGKAGAPWLIYVEDDPEPFCVATDAPPSALSCLPSGNYRGVFVDRAGKRLGNSFPFALRHMGKEPGQQHVNDTNDADPQMQRQLDRLEEQNQKLLATIDKLVNNTIELAKRAMDTQIEVTKVMPKAIEASANMVAASNGGGSLAQAASDLQDIWENAPAADNNLQTVLSSPVVVGAAAALQKYMAQAAENGAEVVAHSNGRRRESMAERAARLSAAADDAAARRAAAARS